MRRIWNEDENKTEKHRGAELSEQSIGAFAVVTHELYLNCFEPRVLSGKFIIRLAQIRVLIMSQRIAAPATDSLPEHSDVWQTFSQFYDGRPPNSMLTMAHVPGLVTAFADLAQACIRRPGNIPPIRNGSSPISPAAPQDAGIARRIRCIMARRTALMRSGWRRSGISKTALCSPRRKRRASGLRSRSVPTASPTRMLKARSNIIPIRKWRKLSR